MGGKNDNKAAYFDKLKSLLEEFKSIFIVSVDNVCLDINTFKIDSITYSVYRFLLSRCMKSVNP